MDSVFGVNSGIDFKFFKVLDGNFDYLYRNLGEFSAIKSFLGNKYDSNIKEILLPLKDEDFYNQAFFVHNLLENNLSGVKSLKSSFYNFLGIVIHALKEDEFDKTFDKDFVEDKIPESNIKLSDEEVNIFLEKYSMVFKELSSKLKTLNDELKEKEIENFVLED